MRRARKVGRSVALGPEGPGRYIVEIAALLDLAVAALDVALVGFLAYGASLVMGGGGFHRDAPEDAALPHLDVSHEF